MLAQFDLIRHGYVHHEPQQGAHMRGLDNLKVAYNNERHRGEISFRYETHNRRRNYNDEIMLTKYAYDFA